ncbi:MAG: winged helix-turn-helix domain-containing protein [Rhodospirillales bacterium]
MAVQGRVSVPARPKVVFRFGVFELNPETRELRKQGIRVRLSGQQFQVLSLLLDRQGECVSRKELQEALWPDDAWGELDLRLNKVVNRVREVLGDSAESPRYLETLPRVGYRFIAPVEKAELPPPVALQPPPSAANGVDARPGDRPKRSRVVLLAFRGLLAAAVLAVLIYGLTAKHEVVLDPEPLTSFVGSESSPGFSPDGSQVVFSWNGAGQDNFDIYTLRRSDGVLQRLTDDPRREFAPSWSRDGQQIAFLRETGRRKADLLLMPAAGGPPRKIGELAWRYKDPVLDWTHDSRWVAVPDAADSTQSAIFLISAETGKRRRITAPPPGSRGDFYPSISSDGTKLVFARFVTSQWSDLFLLALDADLQAKGNPVRLAELKMQADRAAWLPGDRELVFAAGGWGSERFLYRIEAKQGGEIASLGNVRISGAQPAYSVSTGTLAYVRGGDQVSIWEVDGRPPHTLKRVIASTAGDMQPDFSPDGAWIAFSSNRRRTRDIWMARADGTDARQLVTFQDDGASAPRWSPDSRAVAFESRREGQADVYLYTDGSTRNLTNHPAEDVMPSWSADGRFVYFCSSRSGGPQIWKIPREGGPATQVTEHGGVFAIESPDGKYLYYTAGFPPAVLLRRSLVDGSERDMAAQLITLPGFAVTAEGIYYLRGSGSEADALWYLDLSSETHRLVVQLDKPPRHGLSVSRDGKRVLLNLLESQGGDLALLRNVR